MDYELLSKEIKELAEISNDQIAVMANSAALLYEALPEINWAGFYIVKDDALILGPFQGRVACVRIEFGRGVCGTAWKENKTQLVPNVHDFPGHIACDAASNSEIVIPIHKDGKVIAVLDIDSPIFSRFTEEDKEGLEGFAKTLEEILDLDNVN